VSKLLVTGATGLIGSVTGERYIAFGAAGCVVTFPAFVNRACELAGVDHRVGDGAASKLDDPETVARFGVDSMRDSGSSERLRP
jgi:hypothetical protein